MRLFSLVLGFCLLAGDADALLVHKIEDPEPKAEPAPPACPDGARECLRGEQEKVLRRYQLDQPPDLSQFDLKFEGGVYRYVSGDKKGALALPDRLSAAIEALLGESIRQGFRQTKIDDLKKLFPGREAALKLDGLSDSALGALSAHFSGFPRDAEKMGERDGLALMNKLNNAKDMTGSDAHRILNKFFENDKNFGAPIANMDYQRTPQGYQDAIRELTKASAVPSKGLKIKDPPSPVAGAILHEVLSGHEGWRLDEKLDELKRSGDPEIARVRDELRKLSGFAAVKTRTNAVLLLGRLGDEKLAPFFLEKLEDESRSVRTAAAWSLDSIMAAHRNDPKAGWDAYIQKAPKILTPIAVGKDQISRGSGSRQVIAGNVNHFTLMEDRQKVEFLKNFDDPLALLVFMAVTDDRDISQQRGLHTDGARLVMNRIKELSGAKPISALLSDPRLTPLSRAKALAKLNRYNLLEYELKLDSGLVKILPEILFSTDAREAYLLTPAETFSIAGLAWKIRGKEFTQNFLDSLTTMDDKKQHAALLFLMVNAQHLSPGQKKAAQELARRKISKEVLKEVNARARVPFYGAWPKDKLNVAVVMTQADHAREFVAALEKNDYRKVSETRSKTALIELVKNKEDREIRIRLEVFFSKNDWVQDRDIVTKTLKGYYDQPGYQVVVYRGHAGDYLVNEIQGTETQNKVFVDLSCNSSYSSSHAIENCRDCAYFGTSTTATGVTNTVFLQEAMEALSRKMSYEKMQARFDRSLRHTSYRFTGSWSKTDFWEDNREIPDEDALHE